MQEDNPPARYGEPQTHSYLIEKHFRPEGTYRDSLGLLTYPDSYEEIADNLGLVVERRDLVEGEPEDIQSRGHIRAVWPDSTVTVPPGPEARSVGAGAAQARAHHGLDKAHSAGHKGKGQTAAILDTGVDQIWAERLGSRLIAKESVMAEDWRDTSSGHGSWCVGAIAEGAPESSLISIKVLSTTTGSGTISGIIAGIDRAVSLGATVINQSLGGEGSPDDPLSRAVDAADAKGVLMPCAAGNSQRGSTAYTADTQSPGSARGAMCCGAGDLAGNLADFSSWGLAVDARAIGVAVESYGLRGSRSTLSGTSMACPYLSACCAVVAGASSSAEAKKALYKSATDTHLPPHCEGHGIVSAWRAIESLFGGQCAPAPSLSAVMSGLWEMRREFKRCKERSRA